MFDGALSRDDYDPKNETTVTKSAWPWQLSVLVLVMTSLWIVAAVLFPEIVGNPSQF